MVEEFVECFERVEWVKDFINIEIVESNEVGNIDCRRRRVIFEILFDR